MCCLQFTYELRHGSHGAVDAPAAGLEEDHGDETQNGGGQHDAVKAEGELGDAGRKESAVIGPVPGQLEGPQQRHRLPQVLDAGKDQISIP